MTHSQPTVLRHPAPSGRTQAEAVPTATSTTQRTIERTPGRTPGRPDREARS